MKLKKMNGTYVKSAFVIAFFALFGTSAIFAKTVRSVRPVRPVVQEDVDFEKVRIPQRQSDSFVKDKVVMGIIKSVNARSMMIVVTDVSGNDHRIHVNPMTMISNFKEGSEESSDDKPVRNQDSRPAKLPVFEPLEIQDLKNGMWVCITEFNTSEDEAREAAKILVTESQTSSSDDAQ